MTPAQKRKVKLILRAVRKLENHALWLNGLRIEIPDDTKVNIVVCDGDLKNEKDIYFAVWSDKYFLHTQWMDIDNIKEIDINGRKVIFD